MDGSAEEGLSSAAVGDGSTDALLGEVIPAEVFGEGVLAGAKASAASEDEGLTLFCCGEAAGDGIAFDEVSDNAGAAVSSAVVKEIEMSLVKLLPLFAVRDFETVRVYFVPGESFFAGSI